MLAKDFNVLFYREFFIIMMIFVPMTPMKVNRSIPRFVDRVPNVNVTAGRDVALPCVVDNIGDYSITWTHINRHLLLAIGTEIITLIPRFRVTRDDIRTWTLHINDIEPEDRGYYVCQVNMEPIINQVGYVDVVVPPTFIDEDSSPSHIAVHEGSDIELICSAKGVPSPNITWTREDGRTLSGHKGVSSEGEVLYLRSVTRRDMGAYLCIASNKVPPSISKRIILDVHFAPVISVPNQLVGAPVGTSVTLECRVSAFPKAINYWEFQNNLLINSSRQETREVQFGYKTTMKLTLHNLLKTDYGTYVCGSKNSLGEKETNLKLYEIVMQRKEERHSKSVEKLSHEDSRGRSEPISPWNRAEIDIGATSYTFNDQNTNELSTNEFDYFGHRGHTPASHRGLHDGNGHARSYGSMSDSSASRTLLVASTFICQIASLVHIFQWFLIQGLKVKALNM